MITVAELRTLARARLRDAEVLLLRGRHDGAVYLCGYAVELALKARICRTLHWSAFPATTAEFRDYQSFRVHDLEVLLHLSGIESKILSRFPSEWSALSKWNPEIRYVPLGSAGIHDAHHMIEAAKALVRVL